MQQGGKASVTLSGTSHYLRRVVIPLLYNGSARIGLLGFGIDCLRLHHRSPVQLGGPFGFCAFALLSPLTARLSGNRFETYSSSSAFLLFGWQDCMTEGGRCQEEEYEITQIHNLIISAIW